MIPRRLALKGGLVLAVDLLAATVATMRFEAVAFDAFAVFDPRPIAELAEALYPGNGSRLIELWRIRQFEYSWLRTTSGHYADFMKVTEQALIFAANALKLELSGVQRDRLLGAYLSLRTWPDAKPALHQLQAAGLRLAFLSNFTPAMLVGSIASSGLEGVFEHALSTDQAKTYKPSPAAYRLGVDVLGLPKDSILFVAFAGWDAAGAKAFGYPTFWVNRLGLPAEELGSRADAEGKTLGDLVAFALL